MDPITTTSPSEINGTLMAGIGLAFTTVVAVATLITFFMRQDRNTRSDYTTLVKDLRAEHDRDIAKLGDVVNKNTSETHQRINRVRDDSLKRGDIDGPMKHLEETVNQLRSEMREDARTTRKSMDTMMSEVTKLSVAVARKSVSSGGKD